VHTEWRRVNSRATEKGNQILAVLPLEFVGQKVVGMASDGEGKRGFFFCEGKGKEVHEREL
jgi:hypothetical protein